MYSQADSSKFPKGSGWSVWRRYPDYAEWSHAVLYRELEGGPQVHSQKTVRGEDQTPAHGAS